MSKSTKTFELEARDFNLAHTLGSGQTFRWRPEPDGAWIGPAGSTLYKLSQQGARLFAKPLAGLVDPETLNRYLGLEASLADIASTFPQDPLLEAAKKQFWGLRLVRQPLFECLISFIVSAASNIPKIMINIDSMCDLGGQAIEKGQQPFCCFPTPAELAAMGEPLLRTTRMGFRAKFVAQVAEIAASGRLDLTELAQLPYPASQQLMTTLPGVGEKVADCVCLFALAQYEAFPVDTWIKRLLVTHYGAPDTSNYGKLAGYARDKFGPNAGYAQQYLYHYARMNSKALYGSHAPGTKPK